MTEQQNHYYMLTTDPTLTAGMPLPGIPDPEADPTPVALQAREADLYEWAAEHDIDDLVHIVLNQLDPPVRLAVLAPAGPVEDGWTVTSFVPLNEAFGPEGARLVDLVRRAERELINAAGDNAPADRYADAINAQYENRRLLEARVDAVRKALRLARVDDTFWFEVGACVYGNEVLALAGRDLIGTTPEWTWDAYDGLCEPWRTAFGEPVHPDDQARAA
jgi:hypothetical protein